MHCDREADGESATLPRDDGLLCVKMRASCRGRHVSGAERIVRRDDVPRTVEALARRALSHPLASADSVNVKVEPAGGIVRLPALRVSAHSVSSPAEGRDLAARLLSADGAGAAAAEAVRLLASVGPMRGAILLDVDSLERLEPDRERGVRATRMDAEGASSASPAGKNHFAEALVLATKVSAAPGIVGEVCISDDPDYVTGYVASRTLGYCRISVMKEKGDPRGGRVFLYRGPREGVAATLEFLERQAVLVTDMPPCASAGAAVAPPQGRMDGIAAALADRAAAGLERRCRAMSCGAGPWAELPGGRRLAVLASNDYLDLAHDPRVVAAAADAAREWGAGTGGSRLTTGTRPPHEALERHLARFKGTEAAVLYATGYMANVGVMSALAGRGDVVFSDALNHASIIDGCRLSGAEVVVYPHRDLDALERLMRRHAGFRRRVVVSDGVFSMDGDILDLPRFVSLCRAFDAFSVVDEAHATGVVGATGRGLVEHFGCEGPDIVVGTLSKALGAEGGFACTTRRMAEFLVNMSRPFVFSTAPCPAASAASDAALSVLEAEPARVERLRENVAFFLSALAGRGVAAATDSAIVPVVVGDERRAVEVSERLADAGFLVPAIRYPTVARGAARLRFALSSAMPRDLLASAADALASAIVHRRP